MGLVSCPECGVPALARACSCPSCGHALRTCKGTRKLAIGAVVLGLGLAACEEEPRPEPAYGIVSMDEDGDGFEAGPDCDDTDPDIHPDAPETAGDGVDSNCDGADDT